MEQMIQDGVWPVMITPYTGEDTIDYNAVREIIEWYGSQHVSGIFAVCQSSEMFKLNRKERFQLTKFVIKNRQKNMGVIVSGHVEPKIEDQIEDAKKAMDLGADSYVFISNQFAQENESDDVAKRNIEKLITSIPGDNFGIYECPYPYKKLMSPELLKWCGETKKFSFLKDTSCNLSEIKAKLKSVQGTRLKIFNANAATLLDSLKMGVAGYSGVMANFHARPYVWLCKNFLKEPIRAAELQNLLGLASVIENQLYLHPEQDSPFVCLPSRQAHFRTPASLNHHP